MMLRVFPNLNGSATLCQMSGTERKVVFPLCWAYMAVFGSASPARWVRSGLSEPDLAFRVALSGFWVVFFFGACDTTGCRISVGAW